MVSSAGCSATLLACLAALGCTGPAPPESDEVAPTENASASGAAAAEAPAGSIAIGPESASIEFVGSKADGTGHQLQLHEGGQLILEPREITAASAVAIS